LRHHQRLT
jgi:malonate-semialdehyde dehydrogenase (acetylating) / methylmalonate-semialdehyde dehydrogenase